jgi:hypothetical protein
MIEIQTALSTIKTLGELTKMIINGKIDNEVKAKAAELNDSILSLQGTIFALQSQNHELLDSKREIEEKLIKISNWNKVANRYKLTEICSGVFLYALKEKHQSSEPFHYICPNCYANGKQSILTQSELNHGGIDYVCKSPECKAEYTNYSNIKPLPQVHTTSYP